MQCRCVLNHRRFFAQFTCVKNSMGNRQHKNEITFSREKTEDFSEAVIVTMARKVYTEEVVY